MASRAILASAALVAAVSVGVCVRRSSCVFVVCVSGPLSPFPRPSRVPSVLVSLSFAMRAWQKWMASTARRQRRGSQDLDIEAPSIALSLPTLIFPSLLLAVSCFHLAFAHQALPASAFSSGMSALPLRANVRATATAAPVSMSAASDGMAVRRAIIKSGVAAASTAFLAQMPALAADSDW